MSDKVGNVPLFYSVREGGARFCARKKGFVFEMSEELLNPGLVNIINPAYLPSVAIDAKTVDALAKSIKVESFSDQRSILSASMIGTSVDVNGTRIEDYFDDGLNIEKYCLERLEEIREINVFSHTPSALSCLLSFIGFLGQFTCADNSGEECGFCTFFLRYVRQLRCVVEDVDAPATIKERKMTSSASSQQQERYNSLGEILYKMGRCGIVHSMSSLGNRDTEQNQVELCLTHSHLKKATPQKLWKLDGGKEVPVKVIGNAKDVKRITINAFDLCDGVRDGILRMFQNDAVLSRAKTVLKERPALMAVVDNK